jgi:dolichol-phosphate mannosyltransferase
LNFFLNNAITYRDRRLRGRRLIIGLLSFYLACSVGAFVNIRVAGFVVEGGGPWYLAGLAGLVVSSVWNYGVTAIFTWRQGRRAAAMPRKSPAALSASEPELPS